MATRYRLPDGIRDGEIEAEEVWGGCAGGRPEYQLAGGFTLLAPAGQPLERVTPPPPEEPPNFAVVRVGTRAYIRDDLPAANHLNWYGPEGRKSWDELCGMANRFTGFPPVLLIPDPFAEPVALPWSAATEPISSLRPTLYVEAAVLPGVHITARPFGDGQWQLSPAVARDMARALWAAADAAEKEQS